MIRWDHIFEKFAFTVIGLIVSMGASAILAHFGEPQSVWFWKTLFGVTP